MLQVTALLVALLGETEAVRAIVSPTSPDDDPEMLIDDTGVLLCTTLRVMLTLDA